MDSSKPQINIALCFASFSLFPKEIQLEIWFQALPEGQLVYHDSFGPFEPPRPSALYYACLDSREVYLKHYKELYLHNLTCSNVGGISGGDTYPSFYNPVKDTLVYVCADHLLLQQTRCCITENDLLSQARHIAIVAGRECYAPHGSPPSHIPRYSPLALSPEFGFGLWKYIYEHFLYINPVVESVAYVVGRSTINKTARSYPDMRLITTIEEFDKLPLFKRTHRSNIGKKYYENTINDIRSGFEKWKEMHPEAKIPRIEMAFPRRKYVSK